MTDIPFWSVARTASALRAREVSVAEVTQAHLDRIEAVNPAINAITHRVDEAMETARALDAQGMPEEAGPLWGVPVTTKINIDQAGYPNSNGILAQKDATGPEDSPVTSNFKRGGAVIVGRTSTPEFSMRWCTSNPIHGVSLNPWDRAATPGGSSGAAAAAVACGIGAVAHGNDLGGSLRYPAFCCGVASIKPGMGRIAAGNPNQSAAGIERGPFTQMMAVQGPIARSVADLRAALAVMSARDDRDPMWTPRPQGRDLRARQEKPTVGVARNPFAGPLHPALDRAMDTACTGLRDAGAQLRDITPPEADATVALWGTLMFTEAGTLTRPVIEAQGSEAMRAYFDAFLRMFEPAPDVETLLRALQRRVVLQRAWSAMFDQVDLLLMPTSLAPPFDNDADFNDPDSLPGIVAAQAPLMAINVLGLPSVALPTHLDAGRPVGVQLIAPLHEDGFALDIAERLEAELGTLWQAMPASLA